MLKEQIIATCERNINEIKALKDRQCSAIKEKVMREKIAPLNTEIEKMKIETIGKLKGLQDEEKQKLTAEFQEKLNALQKKYENDIQTVVDASEKKKQDNINSILATETYEVESECSKAVARLEAIIEEMKG